jgi:hypothetical protein
MHISTVIDPAHGGAARVGRSTPYGARGVTGLMEKDLTLDLARRVASHLSGEARLTRETDVNVSLGERAAAARRFGARAFVSLHAGGSETASTEVWIHTRSSPRSSALANAVAREMARFGARVRRGDLAVLHPSAHGPDEGACLIELGGLGHTESERRLRDPGHLDAVARALASGVRGFLRAGAPAYGRGAPAAYALDLDLTDFAENQFYVYPPDQLAGYPARVSQAELDSMKEAWDRMMRGVGVALDGTATVKQTFRQMLCECMVTSKVVREAFLTIARDDGNTVTLELGSSTANVSIDGFEFAANQAPQANQRGHHAIDLHDFAVFPRVSTTAHHGMMTKSENLIHALIEAAEGIRSGIADATLRYRACHAAAIVEENRYRTEQGMPGTLAAGFNPPGWGTATATFDLTDAAGNVVATETWHFVNGPASTWPDDLVSIDYAP